MPQLEKGGKFVFGWCVVGPEGEILIPPDAFVEYAFVPGEKMVLFSASRTSGGFILARRAKLEASPMASLFANLGNHPMVKSSWRTVAAIRMGKRMVVVPLPVPAAFGVAPGERVLAVRGSHLGLGMIRRGRIIAEAENHPEIPVFNIRGGMYDNERGRCV